MSRFIALLPLVLGLFGCGTVSQVKADYAPTNENNLREALAQTMKAFKLEPVEAKLIGRVSEDNQYEKRPAMTTDQEEKKPFAVSQVSGQALTQWGAEDLVQFTAHPCMIGSSCGCEREMEYSFAKAQDGTIWILIPKPQEEVHTIYHVGSCSYGCGMPSPPMPSMLFELPTKDIHKVRSVDVPFELHVVRESCTNPMPAP